MAEPLPPAAFVTERPFWRDPVWLMALALFLWNLLDAWTGGWPPTPAEIRAAVLAAGIATARVAAPYVKSYIPWLDRNNPSPPGGS